MKNNSIKHVRAHVSQSYSTMWLSTLGWFLLATAIIVCDQASKAVVLSHVEFGHTQAITSYLNLVLVGNPGAAFSFLASAGGWQRWFFTILSLAVAIFISVMLVRNKPNQHGKKPHSNLLCTALAFLLGGAIGNLIDRIRFGYVIDFIDVHVSSWHWPAFNLADSAITLGAILIIIDEISRVLKEKQEKALRKQANRTNSSNPPPNNAR